MEPRRPMRGRGGGLALLAASACAPSTLVLVTELPPTADRVAILGEDASGRALFATSLRLVEPGVAPRIAGIDVDLDGAILSVFAWERAPLVGLALDDSAIRRAGPGEPTLPPPLFAVRGLIDGTAPLEPAPIRADDLPQLTAPSLQSCPSRVPTGAVIDSNCTSVSCVSFLGQTGCTLDLDLVACGLGSARGRVDSSGVAQLDDNGVLGECTEVDGAPGARPTDAPALSLVCARSDRNECRVDVLAPAVVGAPFADVDRIALFPSTATRAIDLGVVMDGQLGPMVALEDVVVVAGTPARPTNLWCTSTPSRLYVVDAATLAVTTTTTSYRCITAMVRDPTAGGVLAAYGGPSASRLGRFNATGRLLESLALDNRGLSVTRLAASPDGRVFVALSEDDDDGPRRSGQLVALDARTGAELWRSTEGGRMYVDLAYFDDEVVALDGDRGFAYAFEAGGAFRLSAPIGLACGIQSVDPIRLLPFRGPNRWVITTIDDGAEVVVLTDTRATGCNNASAFPAPDADPRAIARWPGSSDPERLMIGLARGDGDAVLIRYDARRTRFVPGLVKLGPGFVGELASVGGVGFATLPHSAELVRIRPRPE